MIDDRTAVLAAVVAAGSALGAARLPGWLPPAVAVAGAVLLFAGRRRGLSGPPDGRRSPPRGTGDGVRVAIGGVGLLAVVGAAVLWRADVDLAGLAQEPSQEIDCVAELGGDPEAAPYGTRIEVVAEGRRWTAVVPRRLEWALRDLRMGDRVRLRATTAPLTGAPVGWVRSRHLAGRLRVTDIEPTGGTPAWFTAANALLGRLERGAGSFSDAHRSLYLGLVVGDDRGQSELTRHRFRVAGLTHLLAVSGQNVAFLLAVLAPLRRRLGARARLGAGLAVVVSFVVLTRAEPSVLRAATMAALALWATSAGRRAPGLRVVSVATVLLLLADPMLIHSVGFQLSMAATLALVVLARPLHERLPGPDWLRLPLSVTLSAQAGALPVMAAHFGTTSLVAVPANLLAEPAAGAVMMTGLTSGVAAGLLRSEVAAVVQWPTRALVWWVDSVARVASQLSMPPLALWAWGLLAAVGALAVLVHRRGGPAVAAPVVVAALVVLCRPPGPLRQDVALGSGATLVERCGARMLVLDGGAAVIDVLGALASRGIGRVDAVVADGAGVPAEVSTQLRARVLPRLPEGCGGRSRPASGTGGAAARDPP